MTERKTCIRTACQTTTQLWNCRVCFRDVCEHYAGLKKDDGTCICSRCRLTEGHSHVVIYRTGGTDNFQWHRSEALPTYAAAVLLRDQVQRQGYFAFIELYQRSISIGLPEGYRYEVR